MRTKKISRVKWLLLAVFLIGRVALAAPGQGQGQGQGQKPPLKKVDLVIALDTSGSMDGLIDSARQKLWDVVNLLGQAQPQPVLRVGLISYGNDRHARASGWVKKESDLTTDLDGIYSKLFALRTNGGTEYVARAVKAATTEMSWDQDKTTLKILFVAGNEPATQDPSIPVESAVQQAREKGIFVNTIYCGSQTAAESAGWNRVATLGAGKYAAIDHNHVVAVATPVDEELAKLSVKLNETYVRYGAGGEGRMANQAAQDKNAASLGGAVAATRAQAKASSVYRNDDWDLVDAKRGGKDVDALETAALPEPLRKMTKAERSAYLDGKAKEREALKLRIRELSAKREAFVKEARRPKPGSKPAELSFDDAVTGTIKAQGEASGLSW
jgi:hypothetical protein